MEQRQQELEALKARIKLEKDVNDLFTNYYYYKILLQNLDYFRIVITRIYTILSSCEVTTKNIINMNRALIESNFEKFQKISKARRSFEGMIDENGDLYLSAVDEDNQPLMDENEQQIIIRNYDEYSEYVENGGKVLYTERFKKLAEMCVSTRYIYMEIIDKLPLFFERQVTSEDKWKEFYDSGRLNVSFVY